MDPVVLLLGLPGLGIYDLKGHGLYTSSLMTARCMEATVWKKEEPAFEGYG